MADRLRAVLDEDVLVLGHVDWLLRDRGRVRIGEADIVVGDTRHGFLVVEINRHPIRRDASGTSWSRDRRLDLNPLEHARDNRCTLVKKFAELPDWPVDLDPITGHAVVFPDVDLKSIRGEHAPLGLDAEGALVGDQ